MSNANDSAFPVTPPVDQTGQIAIGMPFPEPGLTKREYFAAAALQGLLANLPALRKDGFKDRDFATYAAMQAEWLLHELAPGEQS